MPVPHETVTFDVHDFKVYPLLTDTGASPTYGPAVDVPGIAEVSLEPNFITAELKGDAKVIAKKGRIDKFNISATYGKVSLDVLEAILGGAVTDNASTDSTWELLGTNSLPYFKAAFKIDDLDSGLGTLAVTLYKCQLTGGTLISGQTDEFGQPEMEIEGIPLASNDVLINVVAYAATTALPA
jgi:hypothetical protein